MKTKVLILMAGMLLLLAGMAAGDYVVPTTMQTQTLLPGNLIPKFVDPLPVAGGISVVNATTAPILGISSTSTYNIHMREFQSQILPSTFVPPGLPAGATAPVPSYVWGYLTDDDAAIQDSTVIAQADKVRPSYLGPVVLAERGTPAEPNYLNELPLYFSIIDGGVQVGYQGYVQGHLLPVDQTLDWANPLGTSPYNTPGDPASGLNMTGSHIPYEGPWPDSVHIHGGEVAPIYDGGPDSWFTQTFPTVDGTGHTTGGTTTIDNIGYAGTTFTYPNGQEEATIWFHPHGFGVTRLGVYAGMAGVYEILDPFNPTQTTLPDLNYDIPLIIQDRSFDTTGQIFYNLASNPQPNPGVHPFWIPEFIGDVICVNGKTWPKLNVEPRQYRFRLLNGSNARFYDLTMNVTKPTVNRPNKVKDNSKIPVPFIAIATDDGYLETAVSTPNVVIAPGERYEIIVDFSAFAGQEIIMSNSARTPYPGGAKPTVNGTDTVMKFIVAATPPPVETKIVAGSPIKADPIEPTRTIEAQAWYAPLPARTTPYLATDTALDTTGMTITRQLTLNEVIGAGGPLELVVNNTKYNYGPTLAGTSSTLTRETELPAVGDTEIWEIINITADAHPMHTHLTSFQVMDRTPFQAANWITMYDALKVANAVLDGYGPPNLYNVRNADGAIGGNPAINAFLQLNLRRLPLAYELGWKDTVICYPGEVTRIAVRWTTQDTVFGPYTPPDAPVYNAAGELVSGSDNNTYPILINELTDAVGYVWHCHILDHEDNEMMRAYTVMEGRQEIY